MCNTDSSCFQAEYKGAIEGHPSSCKLGLNNTNAVPKSTQKDCAGKCTKCYAKRPPVVVPVKIREEKFINADDVVSSIIWADRAISVEISGRSIDPKDKVLVL